MAYQDTDQKAVTAQNAADNFVNSDFVIPVNKLDADEYAAEDLDGITESLFGSGNLNYAGLQARQTDEALQTNESFKLENHSNSLTPEHTSNNPHLRSAEEAANNNNSTDTDRAITSNNDADGGAIFSSEGNFNNSTISSVAASTLSSDAGRFTNNGTRLGLSSASGQETSTQSEQTAQNGRSGNDGTDGQNGQNGSSAESSDNGDTTIINNYNTYNNSGDTYNNIDNSLINLGDTINELTESLTEVTNVINNLSEVIDITEVHNTIVSVTENLTQTVTTIITNITEITENITNILDNVLDNPLALSLDLDALDTLSSALSVTFDNSLKGQLNIDSVGSNLSHIVKTISGIEIPALPLSAVDLEFDLLGGGGDAEADVSIAGLNLPPLSLNPVESIIGDIDLTITVPDLLTDMNFIPDFTASTLASIENFDLASPTEILDVILLQNIDGAYQAVLENSNLEDIFDVSVQDLLDTTQLPVSDLLEQVSALEGLDNLSDSLASLAGASETLENALSTLLENTNDDALSDTIHTLADLAHNLPSNLDETIGGLLANLGLDTGENADTDLTSSLDLGVINTPVAELPLNVVLNPIEDLAGDIDLDTTNTLDLFNPDHQQNDTDLLVNLDTDILNTDILNSGLDVPLDPIEDIVGDIDLNLGAGLNILGDIADPIVNNSQGGSQDNTLLAQTGDALQDSAGEVVDNLSSTLDQAIGELLNPSSESNDTDFTSSTNIDVIDTLVAEAPVNAVLNPIEDLAGDIDLDITNTLDLFNPDHQQNDTDLLVNLDTDVLNTDILNSGLDIPLDPIENIVGDIDLNVDAGLNVLGDIADPIVNNAQGGSQGNTLLAQTGDALEDTANDIVQEITQDIDLVINNAVNILESVQPQISNIAQNVSVWTESTVSNGSGLFGDLINNAGAHLDQLPEPVGTVAEGIGALHVNPVHAVVKLGGLFGH